MRALLSTYGSRGDIQPMVGLAVQLEALDGEVRGWAPPDLTELLAGIGVPLVTIGQPVCPSVTKATPPPADNLNPRAAELVAAQFDTIAAAEEHDGPTATGVIPTGGWR